MELTQTDCALEFRNEGEKGGHDSNYITPVCIYMGVCVSVCVCAHVCVCGPT